MASSRRIRARTNRGRARAFHCAEGLAGVDASLSTQRGDGRASSIAAHAESGYFTW